VRRRIQLRRDTGGQRGGGEAAGRGVDAVVGAYGQGVVEAECPGGGAQLASAIDFVAGQPAGLDAQVTHADEHGDGQLRLGGEGDLVGDVGQQLALFVGGPVGAQVQLPVDQRVAARGGVGEVDGDLAQTDPAERAAVLAGRSHRVGGGLLVPGLVHDQHRLVVGEFTGREAREAVAGQVMVPAPAGQEVMQTVRATVAEGLGKRPAVTRVQLHQQPLGHLTPAAGAHGAGSSPQPRPSPPPASPSMPARLSLPPRPPGP
jgi:hypothetical protein